MAYHDRNFIRKWTSGICRVRKLYRILKLKFVINILQFLCELKLIPGGVGGSVKIGDWVFDLVGVFP